MTIEADDLSMASEPIDDEHRSDQRRTTRSCGAMRGSRPWRPARPGLGIVEHGAIAVRDGRIVYAGPEADLPQRGADGAEIIDCEGRWITPGLIDCHTHLVYAGDRAHEFELRLAGASLRGDRARRRRHRLLGRGAARGRRGRARRARRCRGSTR